MLPSSSIRTIQEADARLVVVCPPFYLAAAISFAVVFVAVLIAFLATGEIPLTILIPVFVVSLGLATTSAVAVLDRSAGTLQVRRKIFALFVQEKTVPLSTVRRVQIETGKGTRRLEFTTSGGLSVPVGFLTSQSGVREAAEAINNFLLGD